MRKKGILWGAVVGFINGFFASGGGIAAVLLLRKNFKLEEAKAHATSIAVIFPLTIAGLIVYTIGGFSDMQIIIKTALSSSLGALAGAALLSKLPPQYMRLGFGGVMIIASFRMIFGG